MIDEILVIDIKFIYKKRLVFFFLVLVLLKLEVEEEYFVLDYEFEFDYDDDEMVKKVYLLLFNLNVLWLLMEWEMEGDDFFKYLYDSEDEDYFLDYMYIWRNKIKYKWKNLLNCLVLYFGKKKDGYLKFKLI